jgi:hypothetical protein
MINLNIEHFNQQADKFAFDVSRITAHPYYAEVLSRLHSNPARQIYELAHTLNKPVLYISSNAPAGVKAEIQAAYKLRFL